MLMAMILAYLAGMVGVLLFVYGARSRDDDYIIEHAPDRTRRLSAPGLGQAA